MPQGRALTKFFESRALACAACGPGETVKRIGWFRVGRFGLNPIPDHFGRTPTVQDGNICVWAVILKNPTAQP